mmetsp:Transcript_43737/g.135113  ORF Transcript_43737/g.135113 Transcript_43737/m.135113 type:complete len:245 (+) Transcript_43737:4-738(+)
MRNAQGDAAEAAEGEEQEAAGEAAEEPPLKKPVFSAASVPKRLKLGGHSQPARIAWRGNPQKCLRVERINIPGGKRLQLWDCAETEDRFLLPEDLGTGPIRWAEHPELCLDAPGGTQLQFWKCSAAPPKNKEFKLSGGDLGAIRVAAHPNKCLDVPGGKSANGNNLQIWDCGEADDANTHFSLTFFPVACRWGQWSEWSSCKGRCSLSTRSRFRRRAQEAALGGPDCEGDRLEVAPCGSGDCAL